MTRKLLAFVAAAGFLPSVALGATATVYKSPTCGCCAEYVAHLERNGYRVDVQHPANLDSIKRQFGVDPQLGSCHTMVLDGYTFEGHVPVDAVNRVLRERPQIRGLAVPGMPAGSPGMGGTLQPPLRVFTLAGDSHANYFRLPEWPSSE